MSQDTSHRSRRCRRLREGERTKFRAKNQVTLPDDVAAELGIREGDEVAFGLNEAGEVVLRGYTSIPTDQRWFWESEWQEGEREASDQIARGELSGPFSSAEDMFAALNSDE